MFVSVFEDELAKFEVSVWKGMKINYAEVVLLGNRKGT
jgi:hypothetical protein